MTGPHNVTALDVTRSSRRARRPRAGYDDRAWRSSAACLKVDRDLFFPNGSTPAAAAQVDDAKSVCAGCPVRLACLQFALTTNQEFGVWGGYDEDERRILRRRMAASGARPRRPSPRHRLP